MLAPSLRRSTRSPEGLSLAGPMMYVPSGDHEIPGLKSKLPIARRPVPFTLMIVTDPAYAGDPPVGTRYATRSSWADHRGVDVLFASSKVVAPLRTSRTRSSELDDVGVAT